MIDKRSSDPAAALGVVGDGATVMIGGFGEAGSPVELIDALMDQGAGDLTVVSNNAGSGTTGLAALIRAGRVTKIVCSYPRSSDSMAFAELYRRAASTWNWFHRARSLSASEREEREYRRSIRRPGPEPNLLKTKNIACSPAASAYWSTQSLQIWP